MTVMYCYLLSFLQLTYHFSSLTSLSLASSALQTPSSFSILPSLSLGRATAVSPRLTRHSALALCNPANPISLATRTKELNDTAPSQEWEKERGKKTTQHKFLRIHGRSASIYAFSLSPHALLYLSLCLPISILQRSPEWIRDGINGMRRITNRFGGSVALFFWVENFGYGQCADAKWSCRSDSHSLSLLLSPVSFHPKLLLAFNHWSHWGLFCGSSVLSWRNISGLRGCKVALYWSGEKGG